MNRRPPHVHPVDLDALENQIAEIAGKPNPLPPVSIGSPPPADIGRLSADAVLEQYNMAAKSVEEMGEEIKDRIRALERAMRECDDDLNLLKEAADAIRKKGAAAHVEIERTSQVSKSIREIVDAIKAKLETPDAKT